MPTFLLFESQQNIWEMHLKACVVASVSRQVSLTAVNGSAGCSLEASRSSALDSFACWTSRSSVREPKG